MSDRIGPRRWIAWKLVQLAHRIHDAEFWERITIKDPDGSIVIEWQICADTYGRGIASRFGTSQFGGYQASSEEFKPEWRFPEV